MTNPIFADPFGALLNGVRAGREDNLNESRLAADIQAEQSRVRQQSLDRALRVELARSEQEFQAASQAAQMAERRTLQADQNQFTLGLEASRELVALQRERRQNDFTLQRDAAQTDQTIRVEGVRNEFQVGRLAQQQGFTAGQNAADRAAQAGLQGERLTTQAELQAAQLAAQAALQGERLTTQTTLQQGQQGFAAEQNAADRAARINAEIRQIEARAAQGALDRTTQERLVGLRAEAQVDAQRRAAALAAVAPVNQAQLDADLRLRAVSAGSLVPGPDGTFVPAPTTTATSLGGGRTPVRNADGSVPLGGGAALAPTAAFPAPAPPPSAPAAPVARGPVATNGLDIASGAADAASVETRLRSGLALPAGPGVRTEVERIAAQTANDPRTRRLRRAAQAWLRSN